MDIDRLKGAVELMHKTGSDDSQYILVRMRDLEEMIAAWERDQIMQEWLRRVNAELEKGEVVQDGEGADPEETESRDPDAGEDRKEGDPEEPGNREADHGGAEETGAEEHP